MSESPPATITALAPRIRSLAISPVAVVRTCLARIDGNRDGNAFITVRHTEALAEAAAMEAEIRAGRYRSPLHGVPIGVKDLVDVAGTSTTSGSAVPSAVASSDAPVVRALREAGAIVIGKTNLHEFAFGTTSDESAYGPVRHPLDPSRSAGGSSGGSAAALALGMCYGAIGTDTGGSIRIPAAACGIVGLKPTLGELPCEGVVALSTTLDHVGPMGLTVRDVGLLFDAMRGGLPGEVVPAGERLRIAALGGYFLQPLDAGVRRALDTARQALARAGHVIVDGGVRRAEWTPDVYLHIVFAEAACQHASRLDSHADRYTPGVRLRLETARYTLAEDYVRAMHLRDVLREEVDRTLQFCDALLLPTLPIPAPPIGVATVSVEGEVLPVRAAMLKLTQLFNMTGHPAISVPAGLGPDGLPRAIQLVGRRGETARLLTIGAAVEAALQPQMTAGPGSVGGGTG